MTSNNNLKKQAREYAAKHGVSYAQARREITEASGSATVAGFEDHRILTIQQEQRPDGVLPYPFFIDERGFVGRQDFWRGDPFRLIGFVDDPDSFDVSLTAEDFIATPSAAVGKHPVLADRAGDFATYSGPVASVTPHTTQRAKPETVTATYSLTNGDSLTVEVGGLLCHLNADDYDGPVAEGVISEVALHEMLGWLMFSGGIDDEHAMFLDAIADGDRVAATVDAEQVKAWAVAARPR